MAGFQIRLARASDYQAVVALSKGIYNGHDYLPIQYHKWLKTPNRRIFVAEAEGKIVGLSASFIVDNGTTLLGQAGRTLESFRGRGISNLIGSEMKAYIELNFPKVNLYRSVATDDNVASKSSLDSSGYQRALSLSILPCKVQYQCEELMPLTRERLQCLVVTNKEAIYEYSKKQVEGFIVSKPSVVKVLFPKGLGIADWEVFKVISRSNIDFLFEVGDRMFGEQSPSACPRDGIFPHSFSHGRRSDRVKLPHWVCTIYTEDPDLFRAHMLQQLQAALEEIPEDFLFYAFQSRNLVTESRKLLHEELGLSSVADFGPMDVGVFEKAVDKGVDSKL